MSEQWVPILMMCSIFFFCCFCLHSLSHLWSQNDDLLWLSLPRCCSCWQKKDLRCTICESFGNYLNVFVYTAVSSFYSIYAFTTKNTMILFTPPPTDKRGCVCAFYLFIFFCPFFFLFFRSVRFMFSPSQMSCARQLWNVKEDIANSTSRRLYTLHYANE